MNELDFIEALSDRDSKRATAAREFLGKMKTAGLVDHLRNAATAAQGFVKEHPQEIGAALLGAGALTGAQYLRNRSSNGKPSADQKMMGALLASTEAMKDQAERDNRPLSFREDITAAVTPAAKNVADVMARHPVKGAVLIAPVGALAGLRILKALK